MMKKNHKRRRKTCLMAGGLLLIAAALLLTGYNMWDDWRAGKAARRAVEEMKQDDRLQNSGGNTEQIPDYLLNPGMEMPVTEIDGNTYIGVLEIPVLDLSLPVMSGWSYTKLKTAPCRYAGSAYQGNLVIAAHNYRTHFGMLSRLSAGDRVAFTDADGNVFFYNVAEVQVLGPAAIEEMTDNEWALSLFTCTLDGRTRLTVRCDKAEPGHR